MRVRENVYSFHEKGHHPQQILKGVYHSEKVTMTVYAIKSLGLYNQPLRYFPKTEIYMSYIWCCHVGHSLMRQGPRFHPGIFQTLYLFDYIHEKQYSCILYIVGQSRHSNNILQVHNAFRIDQAVSHILSHFISFLQNLAWEVVLSQFYSRKYSSERDLFDAKWESQTSMYTFLLSVYHFPCCFTLKFGLKGKRKQKQKLL